MDTILYLFCFIVRNDTNDILTDVLIMKIFKKGRESKYALHVDLE